MTHDCWSTQELEKSYLPNDFHHLWSILCKNPSNRVSMKSVKTDMRMIQHILPEEVKCIYNEVYKIISENLCDASPKSACETTLAEYKPIDIHKEMAISYLKYGLAGIEVKHIKYCVRCGEKESQDSLPLCMATHTKGHSFKTFYSNNFITILCEHCGKHRKISMNSPNDIDTFGTCVVFTEEHIYHAYRMLHCPVND